MCFNKRVLIGLGVVALGVLALSPRSFGAVAPLLMMAVCPLSMLFMMRSMNRGDSSCAADQTPARSEIEAGESRREVEPVPSAPNAPEDARVRELEAEVERLRSELDPRRRQRQLN